MNSFIKKFVTIILVWLTTGTSILGQNTITGAFPALRGQQVKLVGFRGFTTYIIDSVHVSEQGIFRLSFGQKDYGMGYLAAQENESFIVILTNENISIKGELLSLPGTVSVTSGPQNRSFVEYATTHPRREQVLSAWRFLENIYRSDSLFSVNAPPANAIKHEMQRLKKEDSVFLNSLKPETYVSWFLPVRKLVSSVSAIARHRPEEILATIAAFRKLDYTDGRLYKSGLLKEAIESHFWLIENSGRSLDSVYVEMNKSIDYLVANLQADEQKLNEITGYLFELLEKRSLFTSSEYLALKLLNNNSCTINNKLASQLESYRAMKKGNTAPSLVFDADVLAPGYEPDDMPMELASLQSEYTLVVFGAGWCPHCPKELESIARLYEKWQKYGVEVLFVSLDRDKQSFENLAGRFPFISICDYGSWESPIVKSYYVFATPTMYLLNSRQEILLRPNSAKHMDAWVDWHLVQGHKVE